MIRFYFSTPDFFNIWTIINTIANIVLASIAIFSIWINKRQREEEERARLSFTIVERNNYYCLRITNIGKKAAYNVTLRFNKEYTDLISVHNARLGWNRIQNGIFNIEPAQCVYLVIAEAYTKEDQMFFNLDKDIESMKRYGRSDILWLIENGNKKLSIKGRYNDKYIIDEKLAIYDYIVPGVEIEFNPLIESLNKIQKGIGDGRKGSLSYNLSKLAHDSFKRDIMESFKLPENVQEEKSSKKKNKNRKK